MYNLNKSSDIRSFFLIISGGLDSGEFGLWMMYQGNRDKQLLNIIIDNSEIKIKDFP